ncbi:putative GDSL esterase/lipase [Sesbania bispinosa]|nr:putative GDSL esterase/lipase [Sesbania bispinosa]
MPRLSSLCTPSSSAMFAAGVNLIAAISCVFSSPHQSPSSRHQPPRSFTHLHPAGVNEQNGREIANLRCQERAVTARELSKWWSKKTVE